MARRGREDFIKMCATEHLTRQVGCGKAEVTLRKATATTRKIPRANSMLRGEGVELCS